MILIMSKALSYKYWVDDKNLLLVTGWARDGLSDKQIAENIGISPTTLKNWKKTHEPFLSAIKKGKEVSDYEVENALFLNATKNNNIAAQIFWLKNRRPDRWSDSPQAAEPEGDKSGVKAFIAASKTHDRKKVSALFDEAKDDTTAPTED